MVTTRSGATTSSADSEFGQGAEAPPQTTPRTIKRARVSNVKRKKNDTINSESRGTACGLMSVPVEVFSIISCSALPADLISLSRTCKTFRNLLMRRSAEKVWRCAEANIPELPSYPWSDLCPPQYAALIFSKTCTSCGEHTLIDFDPYLLVRLCSNCRETELVEVDRYSRDGKDVYKLVCKTKLIRLKKQGGGRRPYGSGNPRYCLRKDLERIRNTRRLLSQADCLATYQHWKEEVKLEVEMRKEFAFELEDFLEFTYQARSREFAVSTLRRIVEIRARLRALGWTDRDIKFKGHCRRRWESLVGHPRPLTERAWKNLLPKLTSLIEANRLLNEEEDREARKLERRNKFVALYREFAVKTNPLRPIVDALGLGVSMPTHITNLLYSYPFPDLATALGWSCLQDLVPTERTLNQVDELFLAHWEDIKSKVSSWRMLLELGLVSQLLTGRGDSEDPPSNLANPLVKVNGGTDSTRDLKPLTRVLLRADTVFSQTPPESPEGQGQLLYYPEFVPSKGPLDWQNGPKTITPESYYCHVEAERVSRALLESLGMPDVAYIELAVLGERFVCGRCYTRKAMDWKGIVQHYLDELRTWKLTKPVAPRFRTRHSIPVLNVHDLHSSKEVGPLARVVTVEKARKIAEAPLDPNGPFVCLPCKNYSQMYAADRMEAVNWHLRDVHDVPTPHKDIHYALISEIGKFFQYGGEWCGRWDAYYDNVEGGHY